MSILNKLRSATPNAAPASVSIADWQAGSATSFQGPRHRPAVEMTDELRRVLALVRRPPLDIESARAKALVLHMTAKLSRGSRACACASMRRPCITELLPIQAWALHEAPLAGGLIGAIGVGHGKTGLDILMQMVMGSKRAVLLIPPGLRQQLLGDYKAWAEHFHVPSLVMDNYSSIIPGRPILYVVPYSKFSRAESTNLLKQLQPDLIIADEAHRLRYPDTATTGRVLRWFVENEDTRLCDWSGTLTAKGLKDYAHLAAISLHEGSPLPLEPAVLEEWAAAIDPSDWPSPAGELRRMCEPAETLYQGFHRRLAETKGVVTTKAGSCESEINLEERKPPPIPMRLQMMLDATRESQTRPDGEEFVDALQTAACARQLACGFFYRWKFPRGEPEDLIEAWFAARKTYHREVREVLKDRVEHLDSPQLLSRAAARAHMNPPYKGDAPIWHSEHWLAWSQIENAIYHETEAVWVDDFLAQDAAAWAAKHRGIIWYEHEAFGRRVSELSGLPLHGGGPGAEAAILAETGKRSIVASIKAHGTGRDGLQHLFREQLVANPPASGDSWEQLLGRLSRIGQRADEIDTYVYRHTVEMADAIDRAVIQAKYIRGTMGTSQKLLIANCSFSLDRS